MILKRFAPYIQYLKPVRTQFVFGLVCGIVAAAASGAGLPFVIKYLVPLITSDDAPTGATLVFILTSVPIVFSLRSGGTYLNAYCMAFAGMHVLETVRLKVFGKIQRLPLSFFGHNKVGDLMSRVIGDTLVLQTAIIASVNSLIKEPATLISAIGFLIYLSYTNSEAIFMLIAIATVPACVLPIRMIGKKILKKSTQAQAQAGELNHILNENLASAREVRAYGLENREVGRFEKACRRFFELMLKTVKYDKLLSPLIELVTAFAIVFTLYVAVVKEIPPEIIASILTALYMCYEPIKKLGAVSNIIRKAEASLDRLEYILHTEDYVPDAINPVALPAAKGMVAFNNVSFSYEESLVLKNVQVEIKAGEVIALVGPSGAGKSTFANLIPRFYDCIEGTVTIDGIDVKTIRKSDLRSQIALVSQEAILFSDSIANNIRVGKSDATLDEVKAAAQLANAHNFIKDLSNGYETEVGERGSRLSGGQRQRISIARAFLKNAPIIILDEPTSALDAESEQQIQSALKDLSKGRTVFIIAHRFSTIQHASRILVFDKGQITASGTHEVLYQSDDLYRSLYDKQVKTVDS